MPPEGRPSSASIDVEARALYLRRRGEEVRVRHHHPLLSRYSAVVRRVRSAMTITTEVATLRLVLAQESA
jgi:hypothetical protein